MRSATPTVVFVVVIAALVAALSRWPSSGSDTPSPSAASVASLVSKDISWFIPDQIGWLCNYNYVHNHDGELVLKFTPQNRGLGKILVYSPASIRNAFTGDRRRERVNEFFITNWANIVETNGAFLAGSRWVIIAVDPWGNLDRMFAVTARFGDNIALVRLATNFSMGQEVPLHSKKYDVAHKRFPGIVGTDEVVHAYS